LFGFSQFIRRLVRSSLDVFFLSKSMKVMRCLKKSSIWKGSNGKGVLSVKGHWLNYYRQLFLSWFKFALFSAIGTSWVRHSTHMMGYQEPNLKLTTPYNFGCEWIFNYGPPQNIKSWTMTQVTLSIPGHYPNSNPDS